MELAQYMADALMTHGQIRGHDSESVGINSISYDEHSRKLIDMPSQGAMMADPTIREGYVQTTIADGLKDAASNPSGAMTGFMGIGMGMQTAGTFMGAASQTNQYQMQQMQQQMQQPQQSSNPRRHRLQRQGWTCPRGTSNTGKFCIECGKPKAADGS